MKKKESDEISGPKLSLRFAFPCAKDRLRANHITQDQFDKLELLVKTGAEPDVYFLAQCFPVATRDMCQYLSVLFQDFTWKVWDVRKYWYNHYGTNKWCATCLLAIKSIDGENINVGLPNTVVKNLYSLHLVVGDLIWVHRGVAVETSGQSATLG